MREIKFRAFIDGKWWYGSPWLSPKGQVIVERESIPLLQYTGLKDKNGKEIYEGDIVEYRGLGQIKWADGGARFMVFWVDKAFDNLSKGHVSKYEVIGNIYESKDLLK